MTQIKPAGLSGSGQMSLPKAGPALLDDLLSRDEHAAFVAGLTDTDLATT